MYHLLHRLSIAIFILMVAAVVPALCDDDGLTIWLFGTSDCGDGESEQNKVTTSPCVPSTAGTDEKCYKSNCQALPTGYITESTTVTSQSWFTWHCSEAEASLTIFTNKQACEALSVANASTLTWPIGQCSTRAMQSGKAAEFYCDSDSKGESKRNVTGIILGIVVGLVGMFFLVSGALKSDFVVYRIFASRPALCVGEKHKHTAMIFFGFLLLVFGVLLGVGVIPVGRKD